MNFVGYKKPIVIGQKYGRLTVLKRNEQKKKWECSCECGSHVFVKSASLNNGNTKSCGCLQRDMTSISSKKHGLEGTKIYQVWKSMKQRCFNPNHKSYKYYGGRGIQVCDEWENDFQAFYDWSIANGYTEGLQIDRINNDGNYEPSNCKWVTAKENNSHRRLVRNKNGQYASVE